MTIISGRPFCLAAALLITALQASLAHAAPAGGCLGHVDEAARRSGLPRAVILKVMRAESDGRAHALSRRGAMGCMQIMPATWHEVSARYSLGSNPWNARMNMIGGALYLAELARQFGFPNAFAAYNAGPARFRRHLATGSPLPLETRLYVARLGQSSVPTVSLSGPRWQEANLFVRDDEGPTKGVGNEDQTASLFPAR